MVGVNVPNLKPDGKPAPRRFVGLPGDLEKPLPEEEHQTGVVGRPEFAVDRQPEGVAVETATTVRIHRSQEDPTAEDFHACILPWRGSVDHGLQRGLTMSVCIPCPMAPSRSARRLAATPAPLGPIVVAASSSSHSP